MGDADVIVAGAGAGLSTSAEFVYSGERFKGNFSDFEDKYGFHDMYSGAFCRCDTPEEHWAYWSRFIMVNRYMDAPKPVYKRLLELIKDKEYFVITTNVDHCFQKAGIDKKRLFYTQGDYGLFQCSEGCQNCYMFFLDRVRDRNGADIYRTKSGFTYPLPKDWGDGLENIFFNVTCENQQRADERIPILLELPFKHKGIMCAPFIGAVSIEKYLDDGQIEQVICGGENYGGARPCNFDWVKSLRAECISHDITFCFIETGTVFIKDGKRYHLPKKQIQSEMAYKSGMSYVDKPIEWKLTDRFGMEIPKEDLYVPHYRENCEHCGSRLICNGCSDCGKCKTKKES